MGTTASTKRSTDADRRDTVQRVGASLREIRRGTAMQRLRELVLGAGGDALLELGGADTLFLVTQAGGLRMSELADAMRVDASTATRAVARLEKAGLVARESSPDDRRVVRVVPTDAGTAAQEAIRARHGDVMATICAGFGDAELERLAALLERLVEGIDSLPSASEAASAAAREAAQAKVHS